MTLLFGWPMVSGVLQAFGGPEGLTTANFTRMSQDPYFWSSVGNTLLLIVVMIPIQFVLALAMALLIRAKPRGRLPTSTSGPSRSRSATSPPAWCG
ncbi:hypothetical protein OUO20_15175 [Arthrobacter sp. FX8]|uniref:hypothetical protein n=1 Tax=Arthrobacter sp. FX8 TaxID=2997335 RepID=UPI00227B35E8|nr:hypothetical protein [Arthrobacter sp. FX8]WAJ32461.1 hypothetical protein OUO20_15175 [Arthrobacter sp. FX8]